VTPLTPRRRSVLGGFVALTALVALAAACSGDDDSSSEGSPERREYVEALLSTSGDPAISDDENRCLAESLVDGVGVDRLQAVVTPEEIEASEDFHPADVGLELTDAEGDAFYDHLSDCLDVREVFVSSLTDGDEADVAACVDGELDDDELQALVVAIFTEDEQTANTEMDDALADLYMECVGVLSTD
jgi:hypothetical protein